MVSFNDLNHEMLWKSECLNFPATISLLARRHFNIQYSTSVARMPWGKHNQQPMWAQSEGLQLRGVAA